MSRSLRIAFLAGSLEVSDATLHALDLLPALVRRGHEVSLYGAEGSLRPRFEASSIRVRDLPGAGELWFGRRREFAEEIAAHDVIHVLSAREGRRGGHLGFRTRRPLVLSVTSDLPSPALDAIHRPAAVLVGNRPARDEMLLSRPGMAKRVRVVPPAVDAGRFPVSRRPLSGEIPVLGTITRFDTSSGVEDLLGAVRSLLAEKIRLHAVVAGYGPRGLAYRRRARLMGVASHVTISSVSSDLEAMLSAVDLFVSPRRRDWSGGPILQAMAAGRPVLATGVGAAFSLLSDPRAGRLVPAGEPEALAAGIRALLSDAAECRRLGENGRKIVQEKFPADLAAARTEEVYRWVRRPKEAPHGS